MALAAWLAVRVASGAAVEGAGELVLLEGAHAAAAGAVGVGVDWRKHRLGQGEGDLAIERAVVRPGALAQSFGEIGGQTDGDASIFGQVHHYAPTGHHYGDFGSGS